MLHTLSAHQIALIRCTTSVAQEPDCVPKIVVSFRLSRAMSLALHSTPSTSSSTISSVPGLQRLLPSRNPCADPRERGGDGYTDPEPLTPEPNRRTVWPSDTAVVPRRIYLIATRDFGVIFVVTLSS